jgi:O-antigen/teichoic acid export membrane protein
MGSSRSIARNTLYMVGSHVGARLVGLAAAMLLTRRLGVAEYGQLTLAYAYWGLAAMICEAGFDVIIVREASKGTFPLAQLIGNGMLLRGVMALALYLLAQAALPWQGYDPATLPLVRLALLMLFCSPFSVAGSYPCQGRAAWARR